MTEWDPRRDAWLAGFADGEACFVIAPRPERGTVVVRFQLALRVDDYAIWRKAVQIVCAKTSGAPELVPLVAAIREVRAFDLPVEAAALSELRLRLVS